MPTPSAPFAVLSEEGTRFDMPGILNKVSTRAVVARLCATRHRFGHRRGPSVRLVSSLPILKDLHLTHPKNELQSPCFWKDVFRQHFEPFYVVQPGKLQHYFIGASSGILPNLLCQFLRSPDEGVE
jgi:hypothetical protein